MLGQPDRRSISRNGYQIFSHIYSIYENIYGGDSIMTKRKTSLNIEEYQKQIDCIANSLFGVSCEHDLSADEVLVLHAYIRDMIHPIWRTIVIDGNNTVYEVNQIGEVRNAMTGHIFHPSVGRNGYEHICLRVLGKKKRYIATCLIHRLVAQAFIPNPENKPQVNHKNGNKRFNWVSNLEWATASENTRHAYSIGLSQGKSGSDSPLSIYTEEQIHEVCKLLEKGELSKETISQLTGVSRGTVTGIAIGKRWKSISAGYNIQFTSKPRRSDKDIANVTKLLREGKNTHDIIIALGWKNTGTNRSFINYIRHKI